MPINVSPSSPPNPKFLIQSNPTRSSPNMHMHMHVLPIPSKESHLILLRLFNNTIQTLDSLTDTRYSHLSRFLLCQIRHHKRYYATEDKCSSPNSSDGKEDRAALPYNVLDASLKSSLERLKKLRESKLLENESDYDTGPSISIRTLCLQGKLGEAISSWNRMIHNKVIPDVVTHNHLLSGLCKIGDLENAMLDF